MASSRVDTLTLQALMDRQGTLSLEMLHPIVEGILVGLRALHATGRKHRALTPSLVIVDPSATGGRAAYVVDEGVRTTAVAPPPEEQTWLRFASPEQIRGTPAPDERTDIYALGVIVFLALTTRLPHPSGKNALESLAFRLETDPPTLAAITGHAWPELLERFVARSIARSVDERFRDAGAALEAWNALRELRV